MGKITQNVEERAVKPINLIAYGLGDFFGGGSFLIIGMLYLYFLTEVALLPPAWAGFVFLIGKGWDAISDPLMGYISDRTKSRFGRRRIYFLLGLLPIPLSFGFLWLNIPIDSNIFKFIYYSLAYVLFNTVFTMVMVPYSSLNAEMSSDFKVRARLSGARIIFSQFSALLAGTLPKIIISRFQIESTGYFIMGVIFGILYCLPWIFVFLGTWEIPYKEEKVNKTSIKETFKNIFKNFGTIFINKSFRVHIIMYIFAYTAMDILMALFAYYLRYYLGREDLYSASMGVLLITQMAMLPVYVMISNKKGKAFAFIMGLSIWIVGMVLSFILTPGISMWLILVVCFLIGAGLSAGVLIPWAILPSVTDVDELITTKKRAGTYAGAMTLIRKLVQGILAMPMVGILLQVIGFQSGEIQTANTLSMLKFIFMIGPVILLILGIISATKFKITPKTHKILTDETKRLSEGGSKNEVSKETKIICEQLTGIKYEKLYTEKMV